MSYASSSTLHHQQQRRAPTPITVATGVYAYGTLSDSTPSNMSGSSPYDPEHTRHLPDPLPSIPSTFLPSYYPESRNNDMLPSYLSQTSPNFGGKDLPPIPMDYYPPEGSGGRHMLDGVAMSNIPRPPKSHGVPTYELPANDFGGLPPGVGPWKPKDRVPWMESFPFDGEGGASRSRSMSTGFSMQEAEGSGSSFPRQQSNSGPFNGMGFPPPPNPSRSTFHGGGNSHVDGDHLREDSANLGVQSGGHRPRSLTGEEYAEAVGMYDHILGALPFIQPSDASHDPNAQHFESLIRLASQGSDLLSGARSRSVDVGANGAGAKSFLGKRASVSGTGKQTKCLGCGATETPEWRRGPLGPRTLCNACGLVHMKMVRRQKREAEKEKARAGQ